MDTLFWWTGAIIWYTLALLILCGVCVIIFEMVGTAIFTIRVIRAGRRADISSNLTQNFQLWWVILTQFDKSPWEIKGSKEIVTWPWPWRKKTNELVHC